MNVVPEPLETMAVFTRCPSNLFFHKNLTLYRQKKAVLGHHHTLNYLLFGTEFFIAILKTKASYLQTNSYTETLKPP